MAESMALKRSHRWFSPSRVWAIARNTLTQLVRQRAFYFILIFSLLILVASLLVENVTFDPTRQLKIMKDMSFFAMSIFCTVFAVVATANLIPKDVEDRTLDTILAKPVPRFEYLIGKYVGGMLVILLSILIMTLLLYLSLYARQQALIAEHEMLHEASESRGQKNDLAVILSRLRAEGPNWQLTLAVLAIGLQAMVLGSITLFVSTFASSGLFTVVVAFVMFFVGYIEPVVVDYWKSSGDSMGRGASTLVYLIELVFPNFQSFNLVDGVVGGATLPAREIWRIVAVGVGYVVAYLMAAYFCFAEKEL